MAFGRHQLVALAREVLDDFESGDDFFNRAGDQVEMYAYADTGRAYQDPVDLANAYCSHVSLGEMLGRLGGPADFVFDMNPDTNKVRITGSQAFTIVASADNAAWGFDTAGETSVGDVVEATNDWQRGNISARFALRITATATTYTLPWAPYEAQDVPVMLRTSATDDDSAARLRCLEDLDNRACDYDDEPEPDGVYARARHLITDDGFYRIAWPNAAPVLSTPSWDSPVIADLLGYDGTETAVLGADDVYRFTANRRPRALLWFEYNEPVREVEREARGSDVAELADGGVTGLNRGSVQGWRVAGWVKGIMAGEDHALHYLRLFRKMAPRGAPISLFLRWGDTRRALDERRAYREGLEANGLRYTTDDRCGRLVCQVAADQPPEVTEEYVDDELDVYMRVEMRLNTTPDSESPHG